MLSAISGIITRTATPIRIRAMPIQKPIPPATRKENLADFPSLAASARCGMVGSPGLQRKYESIMPIMEELMPQANGLVRDLPRACMVSSITEIPPAWETPRMGPRTNTPRNMMANCATSVQTTAYIPPMEV